MTKRGCYVLIPCRLQGRGLYELSGNISERTSDYYMVQPGFITTTTLLTGVGRGLYSRT
jgi:hypothetical protein